MFALLVSLALSAAAPDAADGRPGDATADTPRKDAKPALVCRRITYAGSRLAKNECRTQAQWDYRADEMGKWMNQTKN
ncbi:MAG TPA: hypothetical protein VJM13_16230 [Sphingopyxis sp.]|nr:hypothetical protein [Sphingopyxis sp.]